jgi:hypothetical protein
MSASNPGPGRPTGVSEAKLEKQRRVRDMEKLCIPRATIAAVEKCTPAYVGILINDGLKDDAAYGQDSDVQPQPLRRMTARTLRSRAWDYADRNPAPSLSLAICDFWVRLVIAIHENGDGFRLHLGEPGRRFQTPADLVMLRMAQVSPEDVDVKGWLAELFKRGRLIEIDGADIGIPEGLGLTPVARKPRKPPPEGPVGGGDRRQGVMLHAVDGGKADATETPAERKFNSTENPPERKFNSTKNPSERKFNSPPDAAPPFARPSLLSSSLPSDSVENQQDSKEVRKDGRASASADRATETPFDEELNLRSGGISVAPGATEITVKPLVARGTVIPPDWEPSAENAARAVQLGLEPARVAAKFRAYYQSKSGTDALSPDWQARYAYWLHGEHPARAPPASGDRLSAAERRDLNTEQLARASGYGHLIDGPDIGGPVIDGDPPWQT